MAHPRTAATMVVKASGQFVPLSVHKLARSIRRIGAEKRLAAEVAREVAGETRDGMTTKQVHDLVLKNLRARRERGVVVRYSLKEAMRRLGPEGYEFEQYVAAVLRAHGYDAYLPEILHGMRVEQEVDIVARKGSMSAMIECKYRNRPGVYVTLKDVMATWARFEDLREAYRMGRNPTRLTACWIICNTKVTTDGTAFGEYKGMRIIGWEYPKGAGLEQMILEKHLYPVTVLKGVTQPMRDAFARGGIMLCHDLATRTAAQLSANTRLPADAIARVQREAAVASEC